MNRQVDNRIVVITFIFLICIALIGFTAYTIKLTYDINTQISEKSASSADMQQEVARLRSIQKKEAQMDSVVVQANEKIPAEAGEPEIIEFIKTITADGKLTGITFDKRANNDIATQMPFTVTIESSYGVMVDILNAIAGAKRFYSIESMDINKLESGELSFTISMSAYYTSSVS